MEVDPPNDSFDFDQTEMTTDWSSVSEPGNYTVTIVAFVDGTSACTLSTSFHLEVKPNCASSNESPIISAPATENFQYNIGDPTLFQIELKPFVVGGQDVELCSVDDLVYRLEVLSSVPN